MRKWIPLLIIFTFFSLTASALGINNIGMEVEPSRFEMLVAPNRGSIGAITLTNTGTEPLMINANLCDWNMDEQGTASFSPPNLSPASCAGWVTFNPRVFRLNPGKKQVVRFSIAPPANTRTSEYRGAIRFFTQLISKQPGAVSAGNVMVTLYAALPGVKRNGLIKKMEASYNPATKTLNTTLLVESTGSAHIRFNGKYQIKNSSGMAVGEGFYPGSVVFPGQTRHLKASWNGRLEPGEYSVEAILNFEGPSYAVRNELGEYPPNLSALKAAQKISVSH